ncbi:hypothetical protein [Piscirickettsia litoralis]|uniref:Uncharacterized protein n=1 Tax=Piscirickettsia litoralis TaxID=1891921 RepID=A0ABX3A641_9GAMM|nr:hypothetical protein [Piscirickettsia litoralis]ODN41579.1 hypothetical protein BGC07_15865 [Piscirickettsia litoralis]
MRLREKSITRHIVAFSKDICLIGTIKKEVFMRGDRPIGIIHRLDFGTDQFKINPCLDKIKPIKYNNEKIPSSSIILLILLSQSSNIKAHEISKILGIKLRTAYIYKYDLLVNMRDIFGYRNTVDFANCINNIFDIAPRKKGGFTVLSLEEFARHCQLLSESYNSKS